MSCNIHLIIWRAFNIVSVLRIETTEKKFPVVAAGEMSNYSCYSMLLYHKLCITMRLFETLQWVAWSSSATTHCYNDGWCWLWWGRGPQGTRQLNARVNHTFETDTDTNYIYIITMIPQEFCNIGPTWWHPMTSYGQSFWNFVVAAAFAEIGKGQCSRENCKGLAKDNLCLIEAWFGTWCSEQSQLPQTVVDLAKPLQYEGAPIEQVFPNYGK